MVLRMELKGDCIANGRCDVSRAVNEVAIGSDDDSVIYGNSSWGRGCKKMSKSRNEINREVWTYEAFRGSLNK